MAEPALDDLDDLDDAELTRRAIEARIKIVPTRSRDLQSIIGYGPVDAIDNAILSPHCYSTPKDAIVAGLMAREAIERGG
jgi:hypothetical protein